MKVLLIEENRVAAAVIRGMLETLRITDVTVYNGNPSIETLLDTTHFDLILLEWVLSSGSGPDIVRYLRGTEIGKHTLTIMISSKDHPEDVLEAMEAGISDYMLKPVRLSTLKRKVKKLLGGVPADTSA